MKSGECSEPDIIIGPGTVEVADISRIRVGKGRVKSVCLGIVQKGIDRRGKPDFGQES